MTEDRSQDIERYTNGEMTPAEQQAFEIEMAQSAALRHEVAIWQDMEQALRPDREDDLRANLRRIAESRPATAATQQPKRWWGWLSLALVALLLGWYFNSAPTDTPPPVAPPPTESELPPGDAETEPAAPPATKEVPPTPPEKQLQNAPTAEPPTTPAPIAEAFTPNPQLEALIGQQLRNGSYTFSWTSPSANTSPDRLTWQGTLATSQAPTAFPSFRLLVFDNDLTAYQNYTPLVSALLSFVDAETDQYTFTVPANQPFSPGLYYYLIEDEVSGIIYTAGKVVVR